jgi:hypothetical protein
MIGATRQPLKARQGFMVGVARAVAGEDAAPLPPGATEVEID